MSKKIHFGNLDLPTVDNTVYPRITINVNGTEYYVKTKKAETADKTKGKGIFKFGDYEWLIKNSWGKLLPADCSYYMQNNYASTYRTMTALPEELDASNVTDMNSMFNECTNLTTIPQLDTSKVNDMGYMFYICTNLTTIPQLDTSNVTNMLFMFYDCTNLTAIPQLDTSKATNMGYMFDGCTHLTAIPQLDTSKVTDMRNMFYGCTSLPTVFPWTVDCASIPYFGNINKIFNGSSVTEVTFKNVNASIKAQFTASNLGYQLTKIKFV